MSDEGIDNIVQLAAAAKKKPPPLTEDFAALEFARIHRGQLLYDHDAGAWFRWSGQHWQQERTRLAYDWARGLVRKLTETQATSKRRTSFVNGVEKFAAADRAFAVNANHWNADPYLLATPNGTVNLNTGELRDADPTDRINQITAVGPALEVDCPRWFAFLEEATGSDWELIGFLQRWCGYCLTGDIREHALVFCYGAGGSGWQAVSARLSQQRMGGENEIDRLAAVIDRCRRRQRNRSVCEPLHHSRRRVPEQLQEARRVRLEIEPAIRTDGRR